MVTAQTWGSTISAQHNVDSWVLQKKRGYQKVSWIALIHLLCLAVGEIRSSFFREGLHSLFLIILWKPYWRLTTINVQIIFRQINIFLVTEVLEGYYEIYTTQKVQLLKLDSPLPILRINPCSEFEVKVHTLEKLNSYFPTINCSLL